MTDTAPNSAPATPGLINWHRHGRTSNDLARRGVNRYRIDNIAGDDWGDVPDHPGITTAFNDGCTSLIIDGPFGGRGQRDILNRYQNNTGIYGTLSADGYLRALSGTDGGPTPAWATTGMATGMATLTSRGFWWGIYGGKFLWPTFMPTNAAPRNWPTNLADSAYDSLTNWRAMFEPAFASGCAFVCGDAEGQTLSTEPAAFFQTICENTGSHTGTTLGNTSYTGTFTNDRARRFHPEAVPNLPAASWAHSFIANWDVYDASVGDSDQLQVADCTYPPIVVCLQDATLSELYDKAATYLALGTVHVAVDYYSMRQAMGQQAMLDLMGGTTPASVPSAGTVTLAGRYERWGGRMR